MLPIQPFAPHAGQEMLRRVPAADAEQALSGFGSHLRSSPRLHPSSFFPLMPGYNALARSSLECLVTGQADECVLLGKSVLLPGREPYSGEKVVARFSLHPERV